MRNRMLGIFALAALCGASLQAQDLTGDWQGSIKAGTTELRLVFHIAKETTGGWKARLYVPAQGAEGIAVDSVIVHGSSIKLTLDLVKGTYDGKVSADGATIEGTWTQGQPSPLNLARATKETAWVVDPSPHRVQFVTVDNNVQLEVLDWGGSGRPLVFLAGLGNGAHVFDKFAPKLTDTYHVYGITRRGFGLSSTPASGYTADRLADDVLAVLDSLKIARPVLAGHSIAGEELSSVGSRHPERVAGLVYLDAGYPYAFYDRARGNYLVDAAELIRRLERLIASTSPDELRRLGHELLDTDLPALEKSLADYEQSFPASTAKPPAAAAPKPAVMSPSQAIMLGEQRYTDIRGPVLAIYAVPHSVPAEIARDSSFRTLFMVREKTIGLDADAFERGVPSAHVVRIPNADHYLFLSNEADVLREMRAFINGLPREK